MYNIEQGTLDKILAQKLLKDLRKIVKEIDDDPYYSHIQYSVFIGEIKDLIVNNERCYEYLCKALEPEEQESC